MTEPVAYQRRLTALTVLHHQIKRLGLELDATKTRWNKSEKDALTVRDDLITDAIPATNECRKRLQDQQQAHARLKAVRQDKKKAIDTLAKRIKGIESTLNELYGAKVEDAQGKLALGDVQLAAGLQLAPKMIQAIGQAADEAAGDDSYTDDPAGLADLQGQIQAMGITGLVGDDAPAPKKKKATADDGSDSF